MLCPDSKLKGEASLRKEEYPCVSTSAIHCVCVCFCVRVWPSMYYRLKGENEKMSHSETDSAKWQKQNSDSMRDHHGSKKFATIGGE